MTHGMAAGSTLWLAEVDNGVISERKARYDAPAEGGAIQKVL